MAHQTGQYTDPKDLLDKFRVFAVANGWTQLGWSSIGTGDRLHIQKGALFFNLRSVVTLGDDMFSSPGIADHIGIGVNGSTSYSAGSNWDQQPGSIQGAGGYGGVCGNLKVSSATYHFTAHADSLSITAEGPTAYKQLTIGQTTLGYPIYCASGNYVSPDDEIYMESGDTANSVLFQGAWTLGGVMMPLKNAVQSVIQAQLIKAKLQFRGNALLFPSHIFGNLGTTYSSTPRTYVGNIEGVKAINTFEHQDGETITYAGDEYIVAITGASTNFGAAMLK